MPLRRNFAPAGLLALATTVVVTLAPRPAQAQDGASALFASHDPLRMTLEAPLRTITRDRSQDSEESPATATITSPDGTVFVTSVDVRTRGNFRLRRDICPFPPLRLDFPRGDLDGSVLDGQNRLKLVTHCRDSEESEQNTLEEYLVYRIFNALTDRSFHVRLVRSTYVDTESDDEPLTRWSFLIENGDLVAERLGGTVLESSKLHPARVRTRTAILAALFQFMVGNTDFSFYGDHNVLLVETPETVIPVPYDFDWTGLVDARYALPDPALPIRSVRQRYYRGLCRPGTDFAELYRHFEERRPEIEALVTEQPGLADNARRKALEYIGDFYEIIGNEGRRRRMIEESCLRV